MHSESPFGAVVIKGVNSNPVEGDQKYCQLKNIILTLLDLIFRRIHTMHIYIYKGGGGGLNRRSILLKRNLKKIK
jgi:hypothetical protein